MSGIWSYHLDGSPDSFGEINIENSGGQISGTWHDLSDAARTQYGFETGREILSGALEGTLFKGSLTLHFPVSFRTKCPNKWQTRQQIEIALGGQERQVQGRFKDVTMSESCLISAKGWRFFSLRRNNFEPLKNRQTKFSIHQDNFDHTGGGWKFVENATTPPVAAPFVKTGGIHGGYIGSTDAGGEWEASVNYLGDRKEALNGTLIFDMFSEQPSNAHDILLFGIHDSLVHPLKTTAGWASYSIRLIPEQYWLIRSTQKKAGSDVLAKVLSDLQNIRIAAPAGSRLDNIMLIAGPKLPAEDTPPPDDPAPRSVKLELETKSALANRSMNLRVSLVNDRNQSVAAIKAVTVDLTSVKANVQPAQVEIPTGSEVAYARVFGTAPGPISIEAKATSPDLAADQISADICATGPVTHIVVNSDREEALIDQVITTQLYLTDDRGVKVAGRSGDKQFQITLDGVGKLQPGNTGYIADGQCRSDFDIVADRPGTSVVDISLGILRADQRQFRFHLPLLQLLTIVALGGLVGGVANMGQNWKRSQRWKAKTWAVKLGVSLIGGFSVYFAYESGLVNTLPDLPRGYTAISLLAMVGGYLGPLALKRLSDKILPS